MAAEFDLLLEDDTFFDFDPSLVDEFPFVENFIKSSPDSESSWIGEIENQLMNDENNQKSLELGHDLVSEFLADIFADSPTSDSAPVVDEVIISEKEPEGSDESGKEKKADSGSDGSKVESEIEENDDAVAKKRTRRLRNRDAAVRSRERKKEYVKDLETKSKYLERECLRLGRILDCIVAENNSLRLSLQKGSGNNTSMTRQESAVLLLESLLLGSLLWFLGVIIYQFPYQPLLNTKCCLLFEPGKPVVRERVWSSNKPSNTGKCRRCKGSRPRMKYENLTVVA